MTKLRENEAASSTDQAAAYDEIDLYAAAFFEEYLLGDQNWNWALDPKHAADDPNVEFGAPLP